MYFYCCCLCTLVCYGNLKFPLTCNGENENWHLLLSYCRYFGKTFQKYLFSGPLPNPTISYSPLAACSVYRDRTCSVHTVNNLSLFNCQWHIYLCNWGPYVRLAYMPNMLSSWIKVIIIIIIIGCHGNRKTKLAKNIKNKKPNFLAAIRMIKLKLFRRFHSISLHTNIFLLPMRMHLGCYGNLNVHRLIMGEMNIGSNCCLIVSILTELF